MTHFVPGWRTHKPDTFISAGMKFVEVERVSGSGKAAEDFRFNLGGRCVKPEPMAMSCRPPTQPEVSSLCRS